MQVLKYKEGVREKGFKTAMDTNQPEECLACPLGPPDWHYICRACKNEFTMPAPKGPTEENSRVCPVCKSRDIERVKSVKSEACPPGG